MSMTIVKLDARVKWEITTEFWKKLDKECSEKSISASIKKRCVNILLANGTREPSKFWQETSCNIMTSNNLKTKLRYFTCSERSDNIQVSFRCTITTKTLRDIFWYRSSVTVAIYMRPLPRRKMNKKLSRLTKLPLL